MSSFHRWRVAFATKVVLLNFFIPNVFAAEVWEQKYSELVDSKQYDIALEYLDQIPQRETPEAAQHRGFLLGSGLLKSGVNVCDAIVNLEQAYSQGIKFVRGAMDYLYGGDWAGIAAIEGSPTALFEVGSRMHSSNISSNPFLAFDRARNLTDSHAYFFNGARLGDVNSGAALKLIELELSEMDLTVRPRVMRFKQVLCPPREFSQN